MHAHSPDPFVREFTAWCFAVVLALFPALFVGAAVFIYATLIA